MTSALLLRKLLEGREVGASPGGSEAGDADTTEPSAGPPVGPSAVDGEPSGLVELSERSEDAACAPSFALIVELQDVLTRRLLSRQPALLTDGLSASSGISVLPFHRNFLETAALSISAHSPTCWQAGPRADP